MNIVRPDRRPLSKVVVSFLAPQASRYEVHDRETPHLRVIVHPSGRKVWQVCKSHRGRPVRVTIGPFPEWAPDCARREASIILRELARGYNRNEASPNGRIRDAAAMLDPGLVVPPPILLSEEAPAYLYFLFQKAVCVYVGQTQQDIQRRLNQHRARRRKFDGYSYMVVPSKEVDDLEAQYILSLRPKGNRVVRLPSAGEIVAGAQP